MIPYTFIASATESSTFLPNMDIDNILVTSTIAERPKRHTGKVVRWNVQVDRILFIDVNE